MKKHSVIYLGYYPRAFPAQRVGVFKRIRKDGTEHDVDPSPPKIDGVVFGCMEDADPNGGKRFFAVRACYDDIDVPLQTPVVFDPKRHTDGNGFGPQPPTFGDGSAAHLLSDMVATNPGSSEQLRHIAKRLGLTLSV